MTDKIHKILFTAQTIEAYLRAEAGIVKPLVMKSLPFEPSFRSFVYRLSILSFSPTILRRFFFSSCSSSTLAVNFAVAAFLIPFPGVGVDVLLRLLIACDGFDVEAEPDVSVVP